MIARRRLDEKRPDATHDAPVVTSPVTPADVVARLQRGAGNASVARMLAQQDLERPGSAVAPHEPDDRSEDLLAQGPDAFGEPEQDEPLRDVFANQDVVSAQTPTTVVTVPAAVTAWLALRPASNDAIAQWLLDGETHGFITFRDDQRPQMADLAAGKSDIRVRVGDGSTTAPHKVNTSKALGVLTILEGLTRGRAKRWTADPSKPKSAVETGDLIRNLKTKITDAHAGGASADLFSSFEWDSAKGPAQIIQVLQDLPPGTYTIGLPMQGDFFPKDEWLANTQKAALAQGAKQTPPSLIYWQTVAWKSTYAPDKGDYPWKDESVATLVVGRLKSAPLKAAIAALASKGTTLHVMPDYDRHIHITRH
jgi:hypothetical protein